MTKLLYPLLSALFFLKLNKKVDFEEFMKYLDVLLNGSAHEKNEWTFKLVDQDKKGFFTLSDFCSLFESLVHVWVSMTGNQISIFFIFTKETFNFFLIDSSILKNLDNYIKDIYKKMDPAKTNKVNLEIFKKVVSKEPNLLEVFDVLNKGLTNSIDQDNKTLKHKILANQLSHIGNQIDMLLLDLQGHNIILKRMKTNENSSASVDLKNSKLKQKSSSLSKIKIKSPLDKKLNKSQLLSSKHIDTSNFGFSPSFTEYKEPLTFNQEEDAFFLKDENISETVNQNKKPFKRETKPHATMIVESPTHQSRMRCEFFCENDQTNKLKIKRSLTPNEREREENKFDFGNLNEEEEEKSDEFAESRTKKSQKNKENSVVIDSFQSKTTKIITRLKEMKECVKTAQYCLDDLYDNNNSKKANVENSQNQRDMIEEFRSPSENIKKILKIFGFYKNRNKKDEMIYKKMKTITAQKIPKKSILFRNKKIEKIPKDNSSVVFLGHHNWNLVIY